MAIKGRVAGSVEALKRSLKAGTGDQMLTVAADTEVEVRILSEPDQWFEYDEHYNDEYKFFPCDADQCPGCDDGLYASKKVAFPVYDVQQERVAVMKVPKGVAEKLLKRYDKNHTILDRNYTIAREGSGKEDTTYEVQNHPPKKMKVRTLLASAPIPGDAVAATMPDFDADDDDILPPRRGGTKKKSTAKASAGKTRRPPVDDDDEDDDDDPPFAPSRRVAKKPSAKKATGLKKSGTKKKARRTL